MNPVSLHENELAGVHQSPEDVLESQFAVGAVALEMLKGSSLLLRAGKPTQGTEEQPVEDFGIGPLLLGQQVSLATRPRKHGLDFVGVE